MEGKLEVKNIISELNADNDRLAKEKSHLDTLAGELNSRCARVERLAMRLRVPVKRTKAAKFLGIWTPPWERELLFDVLSSSQRRAFYKEREKSRAE